MAVGGAELLGARPGDVDLKVFVGSGCDRFLEPGPLLVGELLRAGAQEVLDPVERVALATAMAESLLLDPASALIDRGGAELHNVKGIEDRDGVFELVIDSCLVALERIESGDLHALAEAFAALGEPVGVGLPRAAWHEVEQSRADTSLLVTGQIDHPRQLLGAATAVGDGLGGDVVPDVLIDAQGGDACEPGRVGGHLLEQRLNGAPHRAPRRAELTSQTSDAGVLAAQLIDRPPARPRRQQRPWTSQICVLLSERPGRAPLLGTAPRPFTPDQPDRPPEAGHIDELHLAASVAVRNHPARPAPARPGGCFDDDADQPGVFADVDDVEAIEADEEVTPIAVARSLRTWARAVARRRLEHRRGLPVGKLGRSRSWKVSTPFRVRRSGRVAHYPHRR